MVQIKCSKCKECNDYGNFNIRKEYMAKLSLSLFLMIDLKNESNIVHLGNYELYHHISTQGCDNVLSSRDEIKYRHLVHDILILF